MITIPNTIFFNIGHYRDSKFTEAGIIKLLTKEQLPVKYLDLRFELDL